MTAVDINGRRYRWRSGRSSSSASTAASPSTSTRRSRAGAAPWLARVERARHLPDADCVVPSFTNPNNLSIVTGVAAVGARHLRQLLLRPRARAEVMMNDPKYLRAGTILAAFADAGATVAVVTAKDKLRALLGHRLRGICFSAEKADAQRRRKGIDERCRSPAWRCRSVYSAELSEFVFAAGAHYSSATAPT